MWYISGWQTLLFTFPFFLFSHRNLLGSLLILDCGWEKRGGGAVNLDLGILLSLRRYTQTRFCSSQLRRPRMVFGSCKIGSSSIFFLSLQYKNSRSDCVGDNSWRRAHADVRHRLASIPSVLQSVLRASSALEYLPLQDDCGNVSPSLSTFSPFQTKKLTHVSISCAN